jgi:transcriptional regulator with GAF, ATPase, and Fis domain
LNSDHNNGQAMAGDLPRLPQTHSVPAKSLDLRPAVDRWIVGESTLIRKTKRLVIEAAPTNSTVLIIGETGTGKEPVINALHYCSNRSKRPLIKMNCAAVPEHLLEDELFGHVKGAFTGAQAARAGRFEQADGGTLVLDEIGEMSMSLQAKLLRVLQEREFERLGSARTVKVDVRIVAATNRDLERAVKEGRFRADLYYRLAVVEIYLPPLRERRDDIPLLAHHFLGKKQESAGWKRRVLFTPRGLKIFCEYPYEWPGNVRELENKVERLGTSAAATEGAADAAGLITEDSVLALFAGSAPEERPGEGNDSIWPAGGSADQFLLEQELTLYERALVETRGNKAKAARILGVKRTTFISRLKRLKENSGVDLDSRHL